jgi:hypothetical protein
MPTKIKNEDHKQKVPMAVKQTAEEHDSLGYVYLDGETFLKALHDPPRPVPYTLADIQLHIDQFLKEGAEPEWVFKEFLQQFDHREWLIILNHTLIKASEKKKAAAK